MDPRNSFIAALAFSDLTLCVFTSPLTLWYTLEGHWPEAIDFGQARRQRKKEWESFLHFFYFARKNFSLLCHQCKVTSGDEASVPSTMPGGLASEGQGN